MLEYDIDRTHNVEREKPDMIYTSWHNRFEILQWKIIYLSMARYVFGAGHGVSGGPLQQASGGFEHLETTESTNHALKFLYFNTS